MMTVYFRARAAFKVPTEQVLAFSVIRTTTQVKTFHTHSGCCPTRTPHRPPPPKQVTPGVIIYIPAHSVWLYDPFMSPVCNSSRPLSPPSPHLPLSISEPPDRLVRDGAAPAAPAPAGHSVNLQRHRG